MAVFIFLGDIRIYNGADAIDLLNVNKENAIYKQQKTVLLKH